MPLGDYFLEALRLPVVVQRYFDHNTVRFMLPAQIDRNVVMFDHHVVELYRAKACPVLFTMLLLMSLMFLTALQLMQAEGGIFIDIDCVFVAPLPESVWQYELMVGRSFDGALHVKLFVVNCVVVGDIADTVVIAKAHSTAAKSVIYR